MKWALRIGIAVVVIVLVAVVGTFLYLDSIARSAIQSGVSYATGVPATLDSADLQPFGGALQMQGLIIANPPGYGTDHFLNLDDADVAVTLGSLMEDTVEVPRLHFTGIVVNLEKRDGQANYQVILDNLEKLSGPPDQQPADAQEGKKYVIREIVVSNVTVNAALLPSVGEPKVLKVTIPDIRLEDVGSDSQGAAMSKVTGIIMAAVLKAVVQQAGEILPAAIAAGLQEGLTGVGDLAGTAITQVGEGAAQLVRELTGSEEVGQLIGEVTGGAGQLIDEGVGKLGEGAGGAIQGAGEAVNETMKGAGDELNKIGEGLGGLLGGNKKQDEQPADGEAPTTE